MPDVRGYRVKPTAAGLLLLAGLAAPAGGCSSMETMRSKAYHAVRAQITSSYHDAEAEAKMAQAESLFAEGRFKEAEATFADLADNTYNPILLAEKARYLEAECLRERGKLFEAVAHYHRLLQDHPTGPHREKACGQIYAISYKWLEETTLADIEAELNGKKKSVPEKLTSLLPAPTDDSRPLLDGEGEALKYLEIAHTHDPVGPVADKALFWCGYVHFYRGRYEDADHFFSQLVEMHKDSPLWQEGMRLAVISKNNSTGGAVYDSQKASEALQLVHHTEASKPEFVKDPEKAAWLTRQKMAVRMQLAQKDFEQAKYYERTDHPASAYFYYELVTRRYPGTKLAEQAKERLAALDAVRKQRDEEKAAGGPPPGPLDGVRQQMERLTGGGEPAADRPGPNATEPPAKYKGTVRPNPVGLPPIPGTSLPDAPLGR